LLHFSFLRSTSRPPCSTLFPYTTLFRSLRQVTVARCGGRRGRATTRRREGAARIGVVLPSGITRAQRHGVTRGTGRIRELHRDRSEEHTSELQSPYDLVCRLLLEKKKKK